jgi:sensor c-di-GMP phosphodiesterase-like protein
VVVDQSTALVAIVAASVPSVVVGVVGYFLRRTLEKLEHSVEDVGKSVATHNTALAVLEQRLVALEQGRVVRLEADHGRLLGLVERLEERMVERGAR